MDWIVIPLVSGVVAALALVSGFGLGTVLMPAFALFFPVDVAIAATGVVHLANNLFKLALVGRWASRDVVLRFGAPAVVSALAGAGLMTGMASAGAVYRYELWGLAAEVTWLKLTIALLLAALACLEMWPRYQRLSFSRRALPIGGILSGFVGGLSGMQGALRAPFLLRAGLSREEFVGTTNVISTLVDVARLAAYGAGFAWLTRQRDYSVLEGGRLAWLVGAACVSGFAGSFLASRLLKRVTMVGVRMVVAAFLLVAAMALGAGIA